MPDEVSYVVLMHLHPDHKSLLGGILQKHCKLLINEVVHGMQIQPNEVYVIPENKLMSVNDGCLILEDRDLTLKLNHAVNWFFESVAADKNFRTDRDRFIRLRY